jgi:Chromosome segregation ATPases
MIESAMYFSMGFFLACLGALVVVPFIHGRAVRLTTRQLEAKIPTSMPEILADKDLLRAEFAMSTRRLETSLDQLRAKSASQLVELGNKSDAVNRLKIELDALRDKVGPTEEEFAVRTDAMRAAERALSGKELQLANVMEELNERSKLLDVQKIEIIALKTQVEVLKVRLDDASNELKASKERRPDLERALSKKESQLVNLMDEVGERSTLADAQKIEIHILKTDIETLKERLGEASDELKAAKERRADLERALSEKESRLAKLMDELNEWSTLADTQKIEINALKTEIETLKERLGEASDELKAAQERRVDREHALSERESQQAKLINELNEHSGLADAQRIEINALKTQVEALKAQLANELKAAERRADVERTLSEKVSELAKLVDELNERSTLVDAQSIEINALKTEIAELKGRLDVAYNNLKAVEERRNSERIELKAASDKLMDERGKFEEFHRRVDKLVQQLLAQSTEDKMLTRRAEELEKRLLEQSQLLNEREIELTHLRGEFEVARKAEADLRVALIEVDSRENIGMQTLETENAKLKAALDRANGERVRLTYELANKNRQAEDPWAAGDIGTDGTQRVAYGRLPRRTNLGPIRLVTGHEDRGVR